LKGEFKFDCFLKLQLQLFFEIATALQISYFLQLFYKIGTRNL